MLIVVACLAIFAGFGVCAALFGGLFVTVTGLAVLLTPLYAGLFWLIFERQSGKDASEESTRTSRAAYRKAQAAEQRLAALDADPGTGRHHPPCPTPSPTPGPARAAPARRPSPVPARTSPLPWTPSGTTTPAGTAPPTP